MAIPNIFWNAGANSIECDMPKGWTMTISINSGGTLVKKVTVQDAPAAPANFWVNCADGTTKVSMLAETTAPLTRYIKPLYQNQVCPPTGGADVTYGSYAAYSPLTSTGGGYRTTYAFQIPGNPAENSNITIDVINTGGGGPGGRHPIGK